MKLKFLASVAMVLVEIATASAQDKPKFYLEGDKVVERFAAVESDVASLKKQVATLAAEVSTLKAEKVRVATAEPAPCVCGTDCKCADGTCPGGCPTTATQTIQYVQVCGPNGCKLVPVTSAAAPATCATGTCSAPATAAAPAATAAGRPAIFPRVRAVFQNRPRLFARFFGGGCCGG